MKGEVMRSEFEKWATWFALQLDKKSDGDYAKFETQAAWFAFQHQQSKVDELQKQLTERDLRIKRLIESEENIARGCESWRNACSKLWKKEDAVTNVLKSIRKELEHGHLSDDESKTLSSYANDLEQALKGGKS